MLLFWTFKLSFDEDILVSFGLATVLATFSKLWADFFPNLLVTLVGILLEVGGFVKKVNNIFNLKTSWVQCHTTFYVRNLPMFVISWNVCHWQHFHPILMFVTKVGEPTQVEHLKEASH